MMSQKKLDTKILETLNSLELREITFNYSINGNSTYNTNIYTNINSDLPAGYKCLGIVGHATNNVYAVVNNLYYEDSNYSLQMWNRSGTTISSQLFRLRYLAIKII